MNWLYQLAYFFAGAFVTNGIPHFVSGLMGRPFQTPFAKPPGQGLSSSTVNVAWGFVNLAAGYALAFQVGRLDLRDAGEMSAFGAGALLLGLLSARLFGRFHGGNTPGNR